MDIVTLRVFNKLHKLALTEQDLTEIEEEQKHRERTGVYVQAVRKNGVAVCVSHDEKHRIVISTIPRAVPKCRILLKTLITFDVPEQIYLLHRIGQYRSLDTQVSHTANNLEELKERLFDRFTDEFPKELGGEYDDAYGNADERRKADEKKPDLVQEQLKALYWVFGQEYDEAVVGSRLNVERIIKVWQLKNKRVALIQEKECQEVRVGGLCNNYRNIDRITYRIRTFFPKHKEYNYVSEGREVGFSNNDDFGDLWLDDNLVEKVPPDEFLTCQRLAKLKSFWFLTADLYISLRREIRGIQLSRRRAEEAQETKQVLADNIRKLFDKGQEIVRQGIIITQESFSYEGITVSGDDITEYITRRNVAFLEQPNFRDILDGYIEDLLVSSRISSYYPIAREISFLRGKKEFQVGNVSIRVEVADRGRMTVNGFRIAKEEIEEVLKEAINYGTQQEFDSFLEATQKVSLKLRKVLQKGYFTFGVELNQNNDCELKLPEDKMQLAIKVVREKDKNYVVVKGRKFCIKNIQSFNNLNVLDSRSSWHYEGSQLQKVVVQLHKAVHNLTAEDISTLISEGISNYRKVVAEQRRIEKEKTARSEEFLAHAARITKATLKDKCYFVKGLSGTEYSVNPETLQTWKGTGEAKEYLCILDEKSDNGTAWGKKDITAKRLLMLSQDLKVARQVYDDGDHNDKHWLEILEKAVVVAE